MLNDFHTRLRKETTLLNEIERPTEGLVCEGVFWVMLYGKKPTWSRVAKAITRLDHSVSLDGADDRIKSAVLSQTVATMFDDRAEVLLFPADIRDWWRITLRYLINYSEALDKTPPDDRVYDHYTSQLFEVVSPHLDAIFDSDELPTIYPWECS